MGHHSGLMCCSQTSRFEEQILCREREEWFPLGEQNLQLLLFMQAGTMSTPYEHSKDSKRSGTVQHKATERKGGKFGWISVILEAMKISIRARSTKNLHRHGGQLTLSLTPTDAGEVSCFDPSMSASTDLKETAGIPKQEHFFQNKWPQPNSWVLIRR